MRRKVFFATILFSLIVCMLVPFVRADLGYVVEDYDSMIPEVVGESIWAVHPSADTDVSARSENFNASQGGYLYSVTVALMKQGSPVGVLGMKLEHCDDDLTAVPNGTLVATSATTLSMASVTSSYLNYTFLFDMTNLDVGVAYSFYLYVVSATTVDGSNYVRLMKNSESTHAGYSSRYLSSAWASGGGAEDYAFAVISMAEGGSSTLEGVWGTESGGGGGGGDEAVEELIGEIADYLVALLVVLLPAFVLGVWLKAGAWGFIIGLLIGSGLGYILMPTTVELWLLFVVLLGVVGMFWKGRG